MGAYWTTSADALVSPHPTRVNLLLSPAAQMDNNTDQFRTAMNPAIPQHDDEFYIDDEMVIFLVSQP